MVIWTWSRKLNDKAFLVVVSYAHVVVDGTETFSCSKPLALFPPQRIRNQSRIPVS